MDKFKGFTLSDLVIVILIVAAIGILSAKVWGFDEEYYQKSEIFPDRYYTEDRDTYIEKDVIYPNRYNIYEDDERTGYIEESQIYKDRYEYHEDNWED